MKDLRLNKIAVSVKKVITRARMYCRHHIIKDLKLSQGWIQKFCARHNLVRRKKSTMISKDPEGLLPGIPSFKKKFVDEVFEGDRYDHDHIINLDETSITRDAPPDYTLEKKGVKTVLPAAMGSEKTSYTTALSVTLNDEKLRAVLIWPGTVTKFKKVSVPENLQQKGHQNTESLGGQVRLGKEFPKRRLLMDGKYLMSIDMRCGKFVSDYFYIKS